MADISKINLNDSEYNIKDIEARNRIIELNELINLLKINTDLYSYGVEWDVTVSSPILTRIGNPLLHKSLPIQSSYRGCIAQGNLIMYYLDPNDWSKKVNGTESRLDGYDGTVRVHTPKFYGKSGSNKNKKWVRISTVKIDDTWMEIPEMLIDAYRCTVLNAVPENMGYLSTLPVNSTISVVNNSEYCRGGSNRANFDTYLAGDIFRSDLGKPRTNIDRATMRTYAANASSELLCYEYYKWIFYWTYIIEYSNFNCLDIYNSELTSDGYHQGGLGAGVTDWDWTSWTNYNSYNPITPCGYCNQFGNFSGIKDLIIPATDTVATHTFKVPRWRCFDNPFGDIWTNLDGIVIQRTEANKPSKVYTTTNPLEFTDTIGKKTSAGEEIPTDGYITQINLGEKGDIIPTAVGGNTGTYMCDYHYCNPTSTALRLLLVGSSADHGGLAGLLCFNSSDGVGSVDSHVGFRTLSRK